MPGGLVSVVVGVLLGIEPVLVVVTVLDGGGVLVLVGGGELVAVLDGGGELVAVGSEVLLAVAKGVLLGAVVDDGRVVAVAVG